jgi:hypothetical protein
VHEDWGWIMVPNWQRVDIGGLWPRICSMAEVMLPKAILLLCISSFGARGLRWGLVSPCSHFIKYCMNKASKSPIFHWETVTNLYLQPDIGNHVL